MNILIALIIGFILFDLSDAICYRIKNKNLRKNKDLIYRLRKRAEIRRQISTRKSVIEGQPDRIADLLDEAAKALDNNA